MTVIDKLTLVNFRAFPGSEPVELRLHGKNLLIYGENGSGKTSIFIALTEILRHPAPRKGNRPLLGKTCSRGPMLGRGLWP